MTKSLSPVLAIVPAAGVGKRMQANSPKQYLTIGEFTILEHTILALLQNQYIERVVVAISPQDEYFQNTCLASHPKVTTVDGGAERVDSVLAGLKFAEKIEHKYQWALVHDAARPCVSDSDISNLITTCQNNSSGGLLAYQVRDTMKRSDNQAQVLATVEREHLWHALTPQMYPTKQLIKAIEQGLAQQLVITDESSAIEAAGLPSQLVESSSENIKVTRPDDLAYAEFILSKRQLPYAQKEN